MADFITPAALINGSVDLYTMAKAANGTREETVNPRLGGSYHTLAYYLTELANVLADNTISANIKLAAFTTAIDSLNITAQQKLDIINGLVAASNTELVNLQSAINTAAAAGAGANGWTDLLVATASGRTQRDKNYEFLSFKDFGCKFDGVTDDAAGFQAAFDYAASRSHGVHFTAEAGATALIKTANFPSESDGRTIFKIGGNVSINGRGATIKLDSAFGTYRYLFSQTTAALNGLIQDLIINENHSNNVKTTNNSASDRRTVFSMWGTGVAGSLTFNNVTFNDVIGVHQITAKSYAKLNINKCSVNFSSAAAPFIDRTSFYCGGNADVVSNKFYSNGVNAVTAIELHNSRSSAVWNTVSGYRYGVFMVGDNTLPQYDTPCNTQSVQFNTFINVLSAVKIWTESPLLNYFNLDICNNSIVLNNRLNTANFVQKIEYGIGTLPNWNGQDVTSVKINDNRIDAVINDGDTTSTQHGISFFALLDAAKYSAKNIEICRNNISNMRYSGINFEFKTNADSLSYLQDITITDNRFKNIGHTGITGYGVKLVNVRQLNNFNITDNIAIDDRITPLTGAVVAAFSLIDSSDNMLTELRLINNELRKQGVATAYNHYALDKNCYVEGYVDAQAKQFLLKATKSSRLYDRKTGYSYEMLTATGDAWATYMRSASKPVTGHFYYGSVITASQPSVTSAIAWHVVQSGHVYGAAWLPSTSYAVAQRVLSDGRVYECSVAGTSGATAPSGATTNIDGGVTWLFIGAPIIMRDVGKVAAHQNNSVASDVTTLRTDLNSLLAALQAANIMQ